MPPARTDRLSHAGGAIGSPPSVPMAPAGQGSAVPMVPASRSGGRAGVSGMSGCGRVPMPLARTDRLSRAGGAIGSPPSVPMAPAGRGSAVPMAPASRSGGQVGASGTSGCGRIAMPLARTDRLSRAGGVNGSPSRVPVAPAACCCRRLVPVPRPFPPVYRGVGPTCAAKALGRSGISVAVLDGPRAMCAGARAKTRREVSRGGAARAGRTLAPAVEGLACRWRQRHALAVVLGPAECRDVGVSLCRWRGRVASTLPTLRLRHARSSVGERA